MPGVTVCDPEVDFTPDQDPLAEQVLAFVELQFRTEELPCVILPGFAKIATDGLLKICVTVTTSVSLACPFEFEQVSV